MKVVIYDSFTSVESGFASTKIIAKNVFDFVVFEGLIYNDWIDDIVLFAGWAEGFFAKDKFSFSFRGRKVHRWIAHGRRGKLFLLGCEEFTYGLKLFAWRHNLN